MNLLLDTTDFSLDKVYFSDKKPNMLMDGFFTKIAFSNEYITMHGLFIDIPLKNPMVNKIYARYILQLDIYNNKDIIQKLIDIEHQLLHYYAHFYNIITSCHYDKTNKTKSFAYNLRTQLQNGSIKYYKESSEIHSMKPVFYIKISGIWENQHEIGITFKIIEYQKQI